MSLPFSAAADRNKEAIADALAEYLSAVSQVLEIGSGTGQHAVYFAQRYSHLQWQPTDRIENLTAITQHLEECGAENIAPPLEVDVSAGVGFPGSYEMAYSANTAHIMSLSEVKAMFKLVSGCIQHNAHFALYGPFSYGGKHTSEGNESFHAMLQQQAAHMGIRDKAELDAIAFDVGLDFVEDIAMPANNRILIWRR